MNVGTKHRTSIGLVKSYRKPRQTFGPSRDTYDASYTKPRPWQVYAHRRIQNKIARKSRKANR